MSPTASRIVDAAQTLIQGTGYNGFSYEDLAQQVGLKKPSLHHYFPHKEDLGATVVERYTERFSCSLSNIETQHASPATRLRAYVDLFIRTYGQTRQLCPCAMLGAESETLPERIRAGVAAFFKVNLSWLEVVIDRGKASGEFSCQDSAETAALLLLAVLEGAMVVGRGLNNSEAVANAGRAAISNLLAPSLIHAQFEPLGQPAQCKADHEIDEGGKAQQSKGLG